MSADNGIYIAEFSDGFRVIHARAIDNLGFFPIGSPAEEEEWKRYFGDAKKFETIEDAQRYAFELADEVQQWGYLEYGINYLGKGVDFTQGDVT